MISRTGHHRDGDKLLVKRSKMCQALDTFLRILGMFRLIKTPVFSGVEGEIGFLMEPGTFALSFHPSLAIVPES
jgi:hypothetical protein